MEYINVLKHLKRLKRFKMTKQHVTRMETLFQTGSSNKELGLGSSWKKETHHLQQHFEKYVSVITGISYHKVITTLYLTVVVTCCRAVAMLHTLGVSVIWVVAT